MTQKKKKSSLRTVTSKLYLQLIMIIIIIVIIFNFYYSYFTFSIRVCLPVLIDYLYVCYTYLKIYVSARHPKNAIKRYSKVLKAYKKQRKLSAAYRKVGIDRNTIVINAQICELAFVAPEKYKELLLDYTPQQRLQDFAKKMSGSIDQQPKPFK